MTGRKKVAILAAILAVLTSAIIGGILLLSEEEPAKDYCMLAYASSEATQDSRYFGNTLSPEAQMLELDLEMEIWNRCSSQLDRKLEWLKDPNENLDQIGEGLDEMGRQMGDL